ncbi:GNAT family N-acetyltransferase [Aspergillus alliaceus]|uniref:GNAT family N-acetyltransferase n=1 Tax=Petromyces alliaceus TaxID=209559 RepID=UPI0012A4950D|nr:acyl-CoA N-acyltransferase [Aspergillus alliaceus]KAB8235719.1 acyl-CoA N-acyltransferase [Aspergillus alliaceus]
MSRSNRISLHRVLPTDASVLATIHNNAFPDDNFLKLIYGPPEENIVGLAKELEQTIRDNPNARFLKAVDNESGSIVGWSWWSIYRDAETHIKATEDALKKSTTPPPGSRCPQAYVDYRRMVVQKREKWIGGKAVAILQVLVVLPEYQGRGIGTKLLMTGVQEAKDLRLPAWLEASPAGYAVYKNCGFHDVGESLDFDLVKYGAVGGRQGYCMLMDHDGTS